MRSRIIILVLSLLICAVGVTWSYQAFKSAHASVVKVPRLHGRTLTDVTSDLGEPTQPFTVLEGDAHGTVWVDAELLLKLKA